MQGDNIGGTDRLQRHIGPARAPARERRVIAQALHAERRQKAGQMGTRVAAADDPHGFVSQLKAAPPGHGKQAGERVFRDRARVAARRVGEPDPRRGEPGPINMIHAAGGGTHKTHRAGLQQGRVNPRDRAHQQGVRPPDRRGINRAPVQQRDFGGAREGPRYQRDFLVGDDVERSGHTLPGRPGRLRAGCPGPRLPFARAAGPRG